LSPSNSEADGHPREQLPARRSTRPAVTSVAVGGRKLSIAASAVIEAAEQGCMPDQPSSSRRPSQQSVGGAVESTTSNGGRRDGSLKARLRRYDAILDRFNALRVLRAGEEQGDVLEEIAELGAPEHDIVEQLLAAWPLAQPDRFEEANEGVMRGLEVLER